jgi:hypothetical protein
VQWFNARKDRCAVCTVSCKMSKKDPMGIHKILVGMDTCVIQFDPSSKWVKVWFVAVVELARSRICKCTPFSTHSGPEYRAPSCRPFRPQLARRPWVGVVESLLPLPRPPNASNEWDVPVHRIASKCTCLWNKCVLILLRKKEAVRIFPEGSTMQKGLKS